jgi:predicted nucleic acid-binding protein
LTDPDSILVLDTSVAINLIATGCAARILKALPNRAIVVDAVSAELEEGRRYGRPGSHVLNELVSERVIEIVALRDIGLEIFEGLVLGRAAETLDDGEAATIACAIERGGTAIIDERKATRICVERFSDVRLACTVDLLAHPNVAAVLGSKDLSDAVTSALQLARMRVPAQYVQWVVDLIGEKQAVRCTSLPRSRRLGISMKSGKEVT